MPKPEEKGVVVEIDPTYELEGRVIARGPLESGE
jgi:hypothetical protein